MDRLDRYSWDIIVLILLVGEFGDLFEHGQAQNGGVNQ